MEWLPFELHSHTNHTDGALQPEELPSCAYACGLRGIALTDHNTTSCYPEFDSGLRRQPSMIGIHGMEWTTYYGHMLVLGETGYTEWRGVRPHQIDRAIDSIHSHEGLVGIAHPYALSNPVNTGYRWGFQPRDWDKIDFIEVWSRDSAPSRTRSHHAFALWDAMLREGYHIAATSGRDWHKQDPIKKHYCVTYLGIPEAEQNEAGALRALRHGRVCVSAGPRLTASMQQDGQVLYPGDTLRSGAATLAVSVDMVHNTAQWQEFRVVPTHWRVILNGACIQESGCMPEPEEKLPLRIEPGWLRVELFGNYLNAENERIAFTNPFYIR